MKLFFKFLLLSLIAIPGCSLALTPPAPTTGAATGTPVIQNTQLSTCKSSAIKRREKLMVQARKDYVAESRAITENAKNSFNIISWYMDDHYRESAEKVLKEKKAAMIPVRDKIDGTRKSALATFVAESALCDALYTPKAVEKSKK